RRERGLTGRPGVLSIHAVDTLGEEGVLADRSIVAEIDCAAGSAASAVLVHGDSGLLALEPVSLALLAQQIENVIETLRPPAARRRVGPVPDPLRPAPRASIVVAPLVRIGGARVLDAETLEAVRRFLYPLASVVVARAGDLPVLAGTAVDGIETMRRAAGVLKSQGGRAVLVSGGTAKGRGLDLPRDPRNIPLVH